MNNEEQKSAIEIIDLQQAEEEDLKEIMDAIKSNRNYDQGEIEDDINANEMVETNLNTNDNNKGYQLHVDDNKRERNNEEDEIVEMEQTKETKEKIEKEKEKMIRGLVNIKNYFKMIYDKIETNISFIVLIITGAIINVLTSWEDTTIMENVVMYTNNIISNIKITYEWVDILYGVIIIVAIVLIIKSIFGLIRYAIHKIS